MVEIEMLNANNINRGTRSKKAAETNNLHAQFILEHRKTTINKQ
ncbi:9961_t:CDS:2 [Ambispora gerdemannii]|uniref:9961_t:CDS:1 n=1 Tax=Ambispora gerdemannii TaxID=144530 RepID=A0A9N9B5E3_9GLOM|nr:9961_t:CDS:2 [Ambispora gerdemannii]